MSQTFKSAVNIDGKVGIGLTNPLDDLHVNTYGTGGIRIQADVTPAPFPVDAHIKFFSGTSDLGKISTNLNNGLQFHERGTHVVTMDGTNGVNVLVGSLTVNSGVNLKVNGAFYDSSNSPGSADKILSTTGSTVQWIDVPAAPSTQNQIDPVFATPLKYWAGTQTQYDAISSPDSNTIYFIT